MGLGRDEASWKGDLLCEIPPQEKAHIQSLCVRRDAQDLCRVRGSSLLCGAVPSRPSFPHPHSIFTICYYYCSLVMRSKKTPITFQNTPQLSGPYHV